MRQQPKQKRSLQLVEKIVLAASSQLNESGLEGFSTSSVAARADVSVGSVYQYFSNKEQLLDAVSEAMTAEVVAMLDSAVEAHINSDLRTFSTAIIGDLVSYIDERPLLTQSLLMSGAQLRLFNAAEKLEARFTELFRSYALQNRDELPNDNLPAAVFVAFTSTLAVAIRLQLVQRPGVNLDAIIELLIEACLGSILGTQKPA